MSAADRVDEVSDDAKEAARRLSDHPWLERLARGGFVASGLIHVMIGGIAVRLATGGGGEADPSGALQALRGAPLGVLLLWACAVGFFALALWQVLDAVFGGPEITDRLKAVGRSALYAVLGGTTTTVARGAQSDSGESSTDLTATLLSAPLGRVLVVGVGLGVVAAGLYHVYKGVTRKFLEDFERQAGGSVGRGIRLAGTLGYAAKGVALVVVGGLFLLAAWQSDPEEASGMDGALKALEGRPFGQALLLTVAVGLALYGVFNIARARYADM
ncbi:MULTISPECIES: DUF1206 domain-containing protein [unclassified Ornithinimicrobium]|uniref:DUF1206 domain-containing protein n=1 Tax=unclassified Ornithinimicrobium TaxID=2615080 RepID=UPI0038550B16